jgi:hypothetical protein
MKRGIAIFLTLLLLLLPVTAHAAQNADDSWTLSADQKTLTHGDVEYKRYYLNPADKLLPSRWYALDETGVIETEGETYTVQRMNDTDEIVSLMKGYYTSSPDMLYVTEAGAAILDAFVSGSFTTAYLMNEYLKESAEMTLEEMAFLDAAVTNCTIDVRELAQAEIWKVVGMDGTGTVGHIHGAVYVVDDAKLYINYDALDNTYFSSNGEFSYRSGTVDAVRLEADSLELVDRILINMGYANSEYHSESEDILEDIGERAPDLKGIFWVLTVCLGLFLPAIPLTFGLVYALKGKCLYPKRWFLLVALSGAWMLVMAAITLLLVG